MFENIIKSLLSGWGTTVLDFVLKYQLIISIVVVAWGIIMLVIKRKKNVKNDEKQSEEK